MAARTFGGVKFNGAVIYPSITTGLGTSEQKNITGDIAISTYQIQNGRRAYYDNILVKGSNIQGLNSDNIQIDQTIMGITGTYFGGFTFYGYLLDSTLTSGENDNLIIINPRPDKFDIYRLRTKQTSTRSASYAYIIPEYMDYSDTRWESVSVTNNTTYGFEIQSDDNIIDCLLAASSKYIIFANLNGDHKYKVFDLTTLPGNNLGYGIRKLRFEATIMDQNDSETALEIFKI